MNNKIKAQSLRLNYTHNFINKSLNYQDNLNFYFIKKYINSILNQVILSKKTKKNKKNFKKNQHTSTLLLKKRSSLMGACCFINTLNGLFINFNYFFDDLWLGTYPFDLLNKKLNFAENYLKKLLKKKVFILHNNLNEKLNYMFLYQNKKFQKEIKILLDNQKKDGTFFIKSLLDQRNYYILTYYKYKKFINFFDKFSKKYEYFNRLHKIFFSIIYLNSMDLDLLVNSISLEFYKQKKGHIYLFRFIKKLITIMFDELKLKNKIKGLSLTIKGRIILKSRKTPRKKKFIIKLGKINNSTFKMYLSEANSYAISNLGLINTKLIINFIKNNYIKKTIFTKKNYIKYRLFLQKKINKISIKKNQNLLIKKNETKK